METETGKTKSSHGESTLNLSKRLSCFGCSSVSLCAIDICNVFFVQMLIQDGCEG